MITGIRCDQNTGEVFEADIPLHEHYSIAVMVACEKINGHIHWIGKAESKITIIKSTTTNEAIVL